ncbi:MAG: 30S ribosomal protein S6 [Firmicutes bacterium]|uniref:Small ribosomal subunit protein bS6 n=1 Tax=Melghirimyces thermohalophilus TaxID=1236220 RepID=A0A1G6M6A5_9BACL|nr:30S ribosomal protein S6 [Melghirimyces thermohalophilus]MDA8352509.1 30S ribosomal protein S6 [Bacillota bacterium]SDC50506.1 small subunit ribosomal protein S6 [Melghirimyces thermohalophilus]
MHKYELMYITRPELDEEALNTQREKVQAVIAQNNGEDIELEHFGKRRLAYLIDNYREGVYTVVTFTGNEDTVNELGRHLKLNDDVIRHMIINIDDKE